MIERTGCAKIEDKSFKAYVYRGNTFQRYTIPNGLLALYRFNEVSKRFVFQLRIQSRFFFSLSM